MSDLPLSYSTVKPLDFGSMYSYQVPSNQPTQSTPSLGMDWGVNADIMDGVNPNITPVSQPQEVGFFGDMSGFNSVTQGLNTAAGLANAWMGMKNYGLAKDSFNFNKNLATTNLSNQANLINQDRAAQWATRQQGGSTAVTPEQMAAWHKANDIKTSIGG